MSKYTLVGGGWTATSKTGDKFIRIALKEPIPAGVSATLWKNKHKKTPKHPDYLLLCNLGEEAPESKEGIF